MGKLTIRGQGSGVEVWAKDERSPYEEVFIGYLRCGDDGWWRFLTSGTQNTGALRAVASKLDKMNRPL